MTRSSNNIIWPKRVEERLRGGPYTSWFTSDRQCFNSQAKAIEHQTRLDDDRDALEAAQNEGM